MKYRLYAGKIQNIPENADYSFIENNTVLLLYTKYRPNETKFAEVPDTMIGTLSVSAKVWLSTAKIQVNAKAMQKHGKQITEAANELLDAFECELQAEQDRRNNETDNADNEQLCKNDKTV